MERILQSGPWRPDGTARNVFDPERLLLLSVQADNERPGTLTGLDCPVCRNKGYTIAVREGRRVMHPCGCMARRQELERIEKSGLSRLMRSCTLESFQTPAPWQRRMRAAAIDFLEKGGEHWFALLGQTGCGKTHLCTALCGELLQRGIAVRYLSWVEFLRAMERLRYQAGERDAFYLPLARAPALYMDDFLKWGEGNYALAVAFDLIDYREKARLPTILSGESFLDEIAARDAALAGRIRQMCGPYLLEVAREPDRNWRLRGEGEQPAGRRRTEREPAGRKEREAEH